MRDIISMVVVLTVICLVSAFSLAYINDVTKGPREYQLLKFVQEPSIKSVLADYDNDPVQDRIKISMGRMRRAGRFSPMSFRQKKTARSLPLLMRPRPEDIMI